MRKIIFALAVVASSAGAQETIDNLELSFANAEKLVQVPIDCVLQEYPNKLGQVLQDSSHIDNPASLHPIFYGCFDWHSSVHGHWLMAKVMNKFPESEKAKEIVTLFDSQFSTPNVQKELMYFQPKVNQSYERTYGWAWLLKLQAELIKSPFDAEHKWSNHLQSLVDQIVTNYEKFLPKMSYPIRVGEHTNTAFGLSLAYDYAVVAKDDEFLSLIKSRAKDFYMDDQGCPLSWEPSGFDFISPCLQEAELMSKVLEHKEFKKWIAEFLPQLFEKDFELEPGKVIDRTDGKLVHLDGLNFSRAWCLYALAKAIPKNADRFNALAETHLKASKDQVIGSDYMGSHWLASFLVYALEAKESN
ncbi:MAG: hypothetical protein ACI857_000795 [Arenicella sp.]|jgi:hypothetical protein